MRSLILLIVFIYSSIDVFSGVSSLSLVAFDVSPKNNNKIVVSNTSPTTISIYVSIARGYGGYTSGQYDPVDFRYSVVYNNGVTETLLRPEGAIVTSDFGANSSIANVIFNVAIPANLVGGQIRLKYKYYQWNSVSSQYNQWIPNNGTYTSSGYTTIQAVTINSVNLVEYISLDPDHFHGPEYGMEMGVFNYVYSVSINKNNSAIPDSDLYIEWEVEDTSQSFFPSKQFLIYPYGALKGVLMNGEPKVIIEANDNLDEFDSNIFVRVRSRTTGAYLSDTFRFSVHGKYH